MIEQERLLMRMMEHWFDAERGEKFIYGGLAGLMLWFVCFGFWLILVIVTNNPTITAIGGLAVILILIACLLCCFTGFLIDLLGD